MKLYSVESNSFEFYTSTDFVTADWYRMGINRVCYDISFKPPVSFEWEQSYNYFLSAARATSRDWPARSSIRC